MKDLKNKVVLVTGSARGIGQCIAKHFLEHQSQVIISDIDQDAVYKSVEELKGIGPVVGYPCNVTDSSQVIALFQFIIKQFGQIDILVNNAGITKDGLFARMSEHDWDDVINVNLKGIFHCSQQAIKYMIKQKYGVIINLSSIIGIVGNPGQANYSASKGAVIALTKTLSREYASRHIRVNAVAPGFIDTAMTQVIPQEEKEKMIQNIPLKKLGKPEDVARAILFLSSDETASFITGQTLVIDGGMI